jgi:hypothetical protein
MEDISDQGISPTLVDLPQEHGLSVHHLVIMITKVKVQYVIIEREVG